MPTMTHSFGFRTTTVKLCLKNLLCLCYNFLDEISFQIMDKNSNSVNDNIELIIITFHNGQNQLCITVIIKNEN